MRRVRSDTDLLQRPPVHYHVIGHVMHKNTCGVLRNALQPTV